VTIKWDPHISDEDIAKINPDDQPDVLHSIVADILVGDFEMVARSWEDLSEDEEAEVAAWARARSPLIMPAIVRADIKYRIELLQTVRPEDLADMTQADRTRYERVMERRVREAREFGVMVPAERARS